jgi:hypothetical protein
VTFEKSLIFGQPQAELIAPGHPLLDAVVDVILERFQPLLGQGSVLVDESDEATDPRLLIYLEHAIRDGRVTKSGEPRAISQRLQFIELKDGGLAADAGPAPYLDYRPIKADEKSTVAPYAAARWLAGQVEQRALGYAIANLVPQHLAEVKRRRLVEIHKVEREVRERLNREINYWDARAARLREEERAGRDQRINAQNAEATAQRLADRLQRRQEELARERQITALPPVLKGAALVIPKGLLSRTAAQPLTGKLDGFSEDLIARAEIERLAMTAVIAAETALGNLPKDVSAEKRGYDIESRDPRSGMLRFIEVKGRTSGGREVIITKNELLTSLNSPEAFFLALVKVENGYAHPPKYVQRFFRRELGFAETAVVFNFDELVSLATETCSVHAT